MRKVTVFTCLAVGGLIVLLLGVFWQFFQEKQKQADMVNRYLIVQIISASYLSFEYEAVDFDKKLPSAFFEAKTSEEVFATIGLPQSVLNQKGALFAFVMPPVASVEISSSRPLAVAPLIDPSGVFDYDIWDGVAVFLLLDGNVETRVIDRETGRVKDASGGWLTFDKTAPWAEEGEEVRVLMPAQ